MRTKTLRIASLTKRFGSLVAVDDVSFSIAPGEFVSVVGPSGSGKSTLLKLVNRLVEPSSGRVTYGDVDVSALRGADLLDWRSRCSMVFQHFHLSGRLDVVTNVLMGRLRRNPTWRTLLGWFPASDRLEAARALERVGLIPKALDRADRLSGGQMQRVAIARALVQRPEVLLADEPISALDLVSAEDVMEILAEINRTEGITIVCNLHNLAAARKYSTRIIGLRAGGVVFDGAPDNIGESAEREIYGESIQSSDAH